jgi:uncharacterized membrane protein
MASTASIKKHPVHPMLVAVPIGLWVFALVCDAVRVAGGNPVWQTVGSYCIGGGIVGALVAAVPGVIDYFSIDEDDMKQIANFHLVANIGAVAIFALNLWYRSRHSAGGWWVPLTLSLIGIMAVGIGGWLGGEMVYVKGMAVEAVEELSDKLDRTTNRPAA